MTVKLAFDRASVRSRDADGRLQVEITNISKAAVNPYLGKEIPDAEELGLDPQHTYMLLRDPEELAKGAETFNRIPVLSKHIPVSIQAPSQEVVIGATGSDAVFEAPYLKNSMVIWTEEAINGIESKEQCEISSAYRYKAVMIPGKFNGVAYDGKMVDIIGNHVAIVDVGRAGPDVVVADHLPREFQSMKKLSRRAVAVKSAVSAFLLPRLAQDAKVDLAPVVKTITAKNYKKQAPTIVTAITALTKGKLAQDADLEGLVGLLDALESDADTAEDTEVEEPKKAEDSPGEKILGMCKAKGFSEDEMAAMDELVRGMTPAADPAKDEAPEKPEGGAEKPDKKAMDAAIKKAEDATVKRMTAIRNAENEVEPFVGKIVVAMDSAEAVYKFCLEKREIDLEGVEPSAYRHMVKMLPLPGAGPSPIDRIAQDGAVVSETVKRFPNFDRMTRSR